MWQTLMHSLLTVIEGLFDAGVVKISVQYQSGAAQGMHSYLTNIPGNNDLHT